MFQSFLQEPLVQHILTIAAGVVLGGIVLGILWFLGVVCIHIIWLDSE